MVVNKDFREFLQLLNEHEVQYLVVGGYAVAFHGHPRYTRDMDIWVGPTPENAGKVLAALKHFGFGSVNVKAEDFQKPDVVIQLGYPPNRLDLLTTLTGVDFTECYEHRISATVDGMTINFIDMESLKRNKRAAGRAQDLADLENIG